VFNLLEGQCAVLVVNAYHVKAAPGRKTDVKEAEWLADLLRHGLLCASFIPASFRPPRSATCATSRAIASTWSPSERGSPIGCKPSSRTPTSSSPRSSPMCAAAGAREILQRLLDGETEARALDELARGNLRAKREALAQAVAGPLEAHHVFPARASGSPTSRIWMRPSRCSGPSPVSASALRRCWSLKIGTDLSRFKSAEHRAPWAGMCSGHAESGGRRLSGRTRRGNPWLRRTLAEVANVASRMKGTYLAAQFRRIAARRGERAGGARRRPLGAGRPLPDARQMGTLPRVGGTPSTPVAPTRAKQEGRRDAGGHLPNWG